MEVRIITLSREVKEEGWKWWNWVYDGEMVLFTGSVDGGDAVHLKLDSLQRRSGGKLDAAPRKTCSPDPSRFLHETLTPR